MEIKKPDQLKKELIENVEALSHTFPIDEKANPFSILNRKELVELKNTIEEFSKELDPKLDS